MPVCEEQKKVIEETEYLEYNATYKCENEQKIRRTIMKFFHLADLHLGKSVHGYSMIEMGDQPYYIAQLLQKAEELQPDAVVIAGDVYDRAVPPKEASVLLDRLLTKLQEMKIPVLMIAGNHDSGTRLGFAGQLLAHQGIYIAGAGKKEISKVTLADSCGEVCFWLVPYLFPAQAAVLTGREDLKDYDSAMRALLEEQEIDLQARNVIVAHQFVTASGEKPLMGGSEATVGGIGQIDASVFAQFDYAALGHIHRAQAMGEPKIRYAGSPLPYHFSEAEQNRGLTVVELKEKGDLRVTVEKLPVLHEMKEVSGTAEEIMEQCRNLRSCYVRAVLRMEEPQQRIVERLRAFLEERDLVLMEVVRETAGGRMCAHQETADVRTKSIEELFAEFYRSLHEGAFPEKEMEKIAAFAAEQTRNSHEDDTERERAEMRKQLIRFASFAGEDEEDDKV